MCFAVRGTTQAQNTQSSRVLKIVMALRLRILKPDHTQLQMTRKPMKTFIITIPIPKAAYYFFIRHIRTESATMSACAFIRSDIKTNRRSSIKHSDPLRYTSSTPLASIPPHHPRTQKLRSY